MSIYDDPFREEFVYLEEEGDEFGLPAVEVDPDAGGPQVKSYPEDMPDKLVGEDGEPLHDEDGEHDEWS